MRTAIAAVLLLMAGAAGQSVWADDHESGDRPRLEEFSALSTNPGTPERERKVPDCYQIHAGTEYATGLSLQGPPAKLMPGEAPTIFSVVDF